jgi:hypothetical protein
MKYLLVRLELQKQHRSFHNSIKHKGYFMDHFKNLRDYMNTRVSTVQNVLSSNTTASNAGRSSSLDSNKHISINNNDQAMSNLADKNNSTNNAENMPVNRFSKLLPPNPFRRESATQSINNTTKQRRQSTQFLQTNNMTTHPKNQENETIRLENFDNHKQSKKQLLQNELIGLTTDDLVDWLNKDLDILIDHFRALSTDAVIDLYTNNKTNNITNNQHFMESNEISPANYLGLSFYGKDLLSRCQILNKSILSKAHLFDYGEENNKIKSNGYRSICKMYYNCLRRLCLTLVDLNEKKNSFLFQMKLLNGSLPMTGNSNLKELQTWVRLLEKIEILLKMGNDMQEMSCTEANMLKYDTSSEENKSSLPNRFHNYGPPLFIHAEQIQNSDVETNLFHLGSNQQEAFFGRACGFQFCDSLQIPLTGCAVFLASYNDGYEAFQSQATLYSTAPSSTQSIDTKLTKLSMAPALKSSPESPPPSPQHTKSNISRSPVTSASNLNSPSISASIGQAAKSLISTGKYMMDPELRAKKVSHIMKNANVEFCKAFWQLTETSIVQMGSNLVTPTLAVNYLKKIPFTPIRLPRVVTKNGDESVANNENDYVTVLPPKSATPTDTISIRILSSELRDGMQDRDREQPLKDEKSNNETANLANFTGTNSKASNKSSVLILHAHGGGFIAHSSKSHEIYLKPWCKELRVPIVSIDYSLAPEHIFPRASEECFYVYAWCLVNKDSLGWTGERIIVVGDSAGGLLVTNIVQRSIINQVRIPDALVPVIFMVYLSFKILNQLK